MAGIHNVLGLTQCDDINDMVPGQTSPVIEIPTSEIIEEISTYFEAAQGMHGNSSEVSQSTAAESDSVDHPVIAQVPVSQAHRYRRRQQSHATTASEESGGESASSVSCKNVKGRRKWAFQALRSPFLEGNSFNTTLPSWKRGSMFSTIQQEARLKTYAVGGFFKCIRLWHRVNKERYAPASSLPAVYMDADEPLSPLSEGNETSDDDAVKVVENEAFVKLAKRKCPQRRGRTPSSAQTKNHGHAKTLAQTKTRNRGKGVRGSESQPHGPSSLPHRGQPEEEEVRVESAQPEDHLFIESAGDHTMLEESSGLAWSDSSSDATCVQDVTLPPARARKRNKKRKPCEMVSESSEVAVKLAPGVADEHENNNNDDEEHRKIKKRKKEKKRKVTEEEEINISPDISQRTSGSTMTINGNDHGVDGSVDQLVNVDIVFSHKASAPTETPTVALKKRKRKKDKMAPCPEDPETNPENTEGVDSFKRPADQEVALEEAASETSDVSQRTSGPTMTDIIDANDANEEHRTRKKKKKLKKRKVTEDVSLDGPCPASETSDVSQPTSGSSMTIINNDHSLGGSVDQLEGLWKPREKSKKNKKRIRNGVITEEEVNVVDTVFTEETGTLTETTTVGFKKQKRKKDKMAPCPEDPKTNAEAENTEGVDPFRRPADREVERPRKKRRKHKMAETSQSASCADAPVEASGSTSVRGKKNRKHGHSFLIDDTAENQPEPNVSVVGLDDRRQKDQKKEDRISAPDVDNGETPMESLTGPGEIVKTRKKKKREREASRASVAEDDEACEGAVPDTRCSAETGGDDVQKKKKKNKKKKKDTKADRESESPAVVEGETPDHMETTVLIKKKGKRRKNPRSPSQGSTPTKACVESGVTTPADSVTASPRCLPAVHVDATQGGHAATPNGGATADPPANKKRAKKREKNRSLVVTCDTMPERDVITTAEQPDRRTAETELRLKKKRKRDRRVMDRIEAETDPGAKEAQQSSHESGVTSPDPVPPESRTQPQHGASPPRRVQKKTKRRKRLFSQQQDFLDISILT